MKFVVYTDGTANLPKSLLTDIKLLPCNYWIDEVPVNYTGDIEDFNGQEFYDGLKQGKKVRTSLINTYAFVEEFEEVLKSGKDVIYISMSSGISGTYNAARIASEELKEKYPDQDAFVVDSHGCGFGSGILALRASEYAKNDLDTGVAFEKLNEDVKHMCQYFTVDDLNFLKQTGRVSGPTAAIATIMNIKPILFGDETGHIISASKVKGRKAAIEVLVSKYQEKVVESENKIVCISHGNCLEDANKLAERIQEIAKPQQLIICMHEPFSGSHVGPGMLGLFFYGKER